MNNHGVFTVYINDLATSAFTFTDDAYTGGQFGFYAAVGQAYEESFPGTPMDARFMLISPSLTGASLNITQNKIKLGSENLFVK